jgi:tRNA A37 threonylcarbamoyladenosine synthetase subunit TsaC/SUA5/YrdC
MVEGVITEDRTAYCPKRQHTRLTYFKETVDFYVDGGDLSQNQPSTLVEVKDGVVKVLRGELPTKKS